MNWKKSIYQGIMFIIIVSMFLRDYSVLGTEVSQILGSMSRDVVLKYFTTIERSQCLGVVTEDGGEIVDFLFPIDFPTYHVKIPNELKQFQRLDDEFESYQYDALLLEPINAGCLAFIVQVNDINFMVKTFERLFHSPKSVYRANRKFLYLPTKMTSDEYFDHIVSELFSIREIDYVPNLILAKLKTGEDGFPNNISDTEKSSLHFKPHRILSSNDRMKVELITHRYVGLRPKSAEATYLDTWSMRDGFLHNANLYPNKISNLMGKELVMCTFHYPPSVVIMEKVHPPIYDGFELRFAFEFAKAFNFTWRFLIKKDEWWGDVWLNGSGLGPSGAVSMGEADVGNNLLYPWEREHFFTDFSDIYTLAELTVILPRPKLLPEWLVIIHPFNIGMWLAVSTSVMICTTALYATSKISKLLLGKEENIIPTMYTTWTECSFRTLGLLVLQVPPDERDWSTPRYVPMRHLVTWLILFFFVVTTGYCSGLSSLLTLPRYEKPIDTPFDMADRNAIWGGSSANWTTVLRDSSNAKLRAMAKNYVVGTVESVAKVAETGEMGISLEKLFGGNFALPYYINERTMRKFRIMKESYYKEHCVFYLRKGSPYMDSINKMIRRARETGLFVYWEDLTVRLYMNRRDQLAIITSRQEEDPGPTALRVQHVTGSMYLLLYGLMLSFVVFIVEIIKHKHFT